MTTSIVLFLVGFCIGRGYFDAIVAMLTRRKQPAVLTSDIAAKMNETNPPWTFQADGVGVIAVDTEHRPVEYTLGYGVVVGDNGPQGPAK